VEKATPGMSVTRRRAVRDGLFRDGRIANVIKAESGELVRIDYIPERRPASLYLADDPTISHLRPERDAGGTQAASDQAAGVGDASASLRPVLKRTQGRRTQIPPPQTDLLDDGEDAAEKGSNERS
jgi:hypothetical protein